MCLVLALCDERCKEAYISYRIYIPPRAVPQAGPQPATLFRPLPTIFDRFGNMISQAFIQALKSLKISSIEQPITFAYSKMFAILFFWRCAPGQFGLARLLYVIKKNYLVWYFNTLIFLFFDLTTASESEERRTKESGIVITSPPTFRLFIPIPVGDSSCLRGTVKEFPYLDKEKE